MALKVLQQQLEAITQVAGLPLAVPGPGAAGVEESGLGVVGAELGQ